MIFDKIKGLFLSFKLKRWPSKSQWRKLFKVLSKKERIAFSIFFILFLSSLFSLFLGLYLKNTKIQPDLGGKFIEGLVGQPRFLNPVYSASFDVDRDIVELLFAGLMKYDSKGKLTPDLIEDYKVKEEGKVFEVSLKENLVWQDGSPIGADDIIFTIKIIQGSDYKSPVRASWLGVDVEKVSDLKVRFSLRNPYGSFLENLTLKIIPEHIWKEIPSQNFPLAIYNLKPVGSGPYKLSGISQDEKGKIISLNLVRNPKYYDKTPYLSEISFRFFDQEKELIASYQKGEIKGFSLTNFANLKDIDIGDSANFYSLSLPRYFAVFLNPEKSKVLSDIEVRTALNRGTNKKEIIEKVLLGKGSVTESPILPEVYGFKPPEKIYQFDLKIAKAILENSGFVEKDNGLRTKSIKREPAFQFKSDLKQGSRGKEVEELQKCLAKDEEIYPEGEVTGYFGQGTKSAVIKFQEKYRKEILDPQGFEEGTGLVSKATRTKLNELCFPAGVEILPLNITLTTVDQGALIEVANILKNQWKNIGVALEIKALPIEQLEENIIKTRNYEALLFGEVLGQIPDPFPFWHSLQKRDPGLNLALYQNKKADQLLEEARQTIEEEKRGKLLEEFQNILIEDSPAVFLYNPDYIYFVSKEIKGINVQIIADPSKRFSGVENWYIETKRELK